MTVTAGGVGAFQDQTTCRWVRYGLANESKTQNQVVKSADLIGFRKRVILPTDVGTVIAQFVSRECKKEGWRYTGSGREPAQARWRDFINANGGDAAFASGPGSFHYSTEVSMNKEKRRAQFLKIGLKIAKKEGLAKLTVAAVAREAKVTGPLVFHQFGSRAGFHGAVAAEAKAAGVSLDTKPAPAPKKRQVIKTKPRGASGKRFKSQPAPATA